MSIVSKNQVHSVVRQAQGNAMFVVEGSDLSNELRQYLFGASDRSADHDSRNKFATHRPLAQALQHGTKLRNSDP